MPDIEPITVVDALVGVISDAITTFAEDNPDADVDTMDLAQALAVVTYAFVADDGEDVEPADNVGAGV
jgi:hypothetical protein